MPTADHRDAPVNIHGTALVIGELGILITGRSGAGKSRLAMELMQAARWRDRFSALIGDDRVILQRIGGRVIAGVPGSIGGLIELRGAGILERPYLPRAVLHLAVAVGGPEPDRRLPDTDAVCQPLAGVKLPLLHLVPGQLPDPLEVLDAFCERRLAG